MIKPDTMIRAGAACLGGILAFGSLTSCGQLQRSTAGHPAAASLPASPSVTSSTAGAERNVVVIGDSLSTGYGTSPELAWPLLLDQDTASQPEHLHMINGARNGSGYLSVGENDETFSSEVAATVTPDTDVVVFFGSENDMGSDSQALQQAALAGISQAHDAAPAARILVVGPPGYTDTPEPERLSVRDQDQAAAELAGVTFVDPIAAQWIVGRADTLIGPDGDHPSEAGQRYLETKFAQLLGATGIPTPPGSGAP